MPHSSSMAAQHRAQRDAAGRPGLVEQAFEDLEALGTNTDATRYVTAEAHRLAADVALARATASARPRRGARPRVWGLDARLFAADLHRMHREIHPGH